MKTVKIIFLYSVLVILLFYVFLVDVKLEDQLAISAFAQERETIFEGFDTEVDSFVDAMTDEKSGAIFVDFDPIYIVIQQHEYYGTLFFYIRSYENSGINFASDGEHLIRVGEDEPFSLNYDKKRNCLFPKTTGEGVYVVEALVKGEEVKLRYEEIKAESRYNQVDRKLQNIFLGFVYCKAAKLFGWQDLKVSPELPPVKLNIYTPTDPDSKIEVQVNIQGNPDLNLIKYKGKSYTSIRIGGTEVLRLNSNGEYVYIDNVMNVYITDYYLVIRDSNGTVVYKEGLPARFFAFEEKRWPEGETAVKKALESAPLGSIDIEGDGRERDLLYGFWELWKWGVDNLNFPLLDISPQVSDDYATYEKKLREGNVLQGSLHCPNKAGYTCPSCSSASGYINHFKGFNVLTTDEDCYVKLTYNDGDYLGNQNNCEVTIQGEKWLGLENESGAKLVEEINKGIFDFKPANKIVERTMNFPGDNYEYEFANEGKEFRLYLSRNQEEAFKAVPWQNIVIEIKNKDTGKIFKYNLEKGIFPLAYAWSNGVANYGQCVWWAAKRWVEEVDSKTLFPFYPTSPEAVNIKTIESNYQPEKYDVLIDYNPNKTSELGHYGFVEKVNGDKIYITQFNFIPPSEVYNHVPRAWNGNAKSLYYSNNPSDLYYFKYYYRK